MVNTSVPKSCVKRLRLLRLIRKVDCLICGGEDTVTVSNKARFDLSVSNVICTTCGLVYINPRFTLKALAEYYRNEFRNDSNTAHLTTEGFRLLKQAKVRLLQKVIPLSARVLEIGCSCGVLLSELRRARPDVHIAGIEPTPVLAAMAKESGLDVLCGMFEEFALEPESQDFVILEHALEHMDDPLSILQRARSMLSKNGLVFVEVPDIMHPYGDLDRNFFQLAHLYSFSAQTLGLLLRRAGLQPMVLRSGKSGITAIASKGKVCRKIDFQKQGDDFRQVLDFLSEYRRTFRNHTLAV